MLEVVGGGGLRLLVDPAHGGRIVSLRHDGHEWLAPSTPPPAGSTRFVRAGTGGWDEALPTVAASAGAPDHGDLWNVSWWKVGRAPNALTPAALTLSVHSASSLVTLERTIAATADGVELRYRASTAADDERAFLWSAHPLVMAEPGTTFELPGSLALSEEYPNRGAVRIAPPGSWVEDAGAARSAVKAFVASRDLTATPSAVAVAGRCDPETPSVDEAVASIVRDDGRRLRFSWFPEEIPWLGLYWDTGEFSERPVVALEPTSASTDHLGRDSSPWAVSRGRARTWSFRVSASAH